MTEETQDRIDDYLLGRGPEPGDEFSDAIASTRHAIEAIELAETERLKARLQRLDGEIRQKTGGKVVTMAPRRNYRWLAYAAAVLLLLTAGWFLLQNGPVTIDGSDDLLALAEVAPYENIAYTITKGAGAEDPREAAFIAYEDGNYELAAERFSALPATDPVNLFYLAQSQLANRAYAEALTNFSALAETPGFQLAQESSFYAAVSQLGLGEARDAAIDRLEAIAAEAGHPSRREALQLLDALK